MAAKFKLGDCVRVELGNEVMKCVVIDMERISQSADTWCYDLACSDGEILEYIKEDALRKL